MGNFRDLEVWRLARVLAVLSRRASASLPPEERYSLGDQWRRAGYSVALNIAEGAGRAPGDFRRYLGYALGSLDELDAIFDLARDFATIPAEALDELERTRSTCARMIQGLRRSLARAKTGPAAGTRGGITGNR